MKKLIIIALLLVSSQAAFSQHYYRGNHNNLRNKPVTFQVVPTVVDFDGIKYGFGIGMNIKQVISFNYFHTRDYSVNEDKPYLDNRFAGFHLSIAQPLTQNIELAVGARKGALNGEFQKTILTGELRYKFKESWRFALEYGSNGNKNMTGAKLIFNLY